MSDAMALGGWSQVLEETCGLQKGSVSYFFKGAVDNFEEVRPAPRVVPPFGLPLSRSSSLCTRSSASSYASFSASWSFFSLLNLIAQASTVASYSACSTCLASWASSSMTFSR